MSRYIDADALKKDVEGFPNCYNGWSDTYDKAFIIGAIEEQPSIDIVRCAECVYCNVQNTKYLYAICERHGIEFKPFEDDTRTHGCTWGERKGE